MADGKIPAKTRRNLDAYHKLYDSNGEPEYDKHVGDDDDDSYYNNKEEEEEEDDDGNNGCGRQLMIL